MRTLITSKAKIILSALLFFMFGVSIIWARAGGGGGGGGGCGGGGFHGGGGGGGAPLFSQKNWPILVLGCAGLALLTYVMNWWSNKKVQKYEEKAATALKEFSEIDVEWDENHLEDMVGKSFMAIQKAWCEEDLPALEKRLLPDLYAKWEKDIRFYKEVGQKNYMDDLQIDQVKIVSVENHTQWEKDLITACIDAGARDYFKTDDGKYFAADNSQTALTTGSDVLFKHFREFWTYKRTGWKDWRLTLVEQEGEWVQDDVKPVVEDKPDTIS